MKTQLTIILFLVCMAGMGQFWTQGTSEYDQVITDSVVWRTIEVVNKGDTAACKTLRGKYHHDWVYSEGWRKKGRGVVLLTMLAFIVIGTMNNVTEYAEIVDEKELQEEFWYQHRKPHVESEYELLDEKVPNDSTYIFGGQGIKIDTMSVQDVKSFYKWNNITISVDTTVWQPKNRNK